MHIYKVAKNTRRSCNARAYNIRIDLCLTHTNKTKLTDVLDDRGGEQNAPFKAPVQGRADGRDRKKTKTDGTTG